MPSNKEGIRLECYLSRWRVRRLRCLHSPVDITRDWGHSSGSKTKVCRQASIAFEAHTTNNLEDLVIEGAEGDPDEGKDDDELDILEVLEKISQLRSKESQES